jgi:hypothetical protein
MNTPRNDPADRRMYPPIPNERTTPGPWEVHSQEGGGWHLAAAGSRQGSGHAHEQCIGTVGQEDDARLMSVLVDRMRRGDPSPLDRTYRITPSPWLLRAEISPQVGLGWHVYAEDAEVGHVCIATFHRQVDAAVAVTVVNGLALLEGLSRAAG